MEFCARCGEEMFTDSSGVAHHTSDDGDGIDYEADGDHTPYLYGALY